MAPDPGGDPWDTASEEPTQNEKADNQQMAFTMTPAIIIGNDMLVQGSIVASEEWRKHTEVRQRGLPGEKSLAELDWA
jgi:protein-disulfide isomerase